MKYGQKLKSIRYILNNNGIKWEILLVQYYEPGKFLVKKHCGEHFRYADAMAAATKLGKGRVNV